MLLHPHFGKLMSKDDTRKDITTGDIARGLLDMIAMNVAQLAYLNAMRFRITRIIFAGNFFASKRFINGNDKFCHSLLVSR